MISSEIKSVCSLLLHTQESILLLELILQILNLVSMHMGLLGTGTEHIYFSPTRRTDGRHRISHWSADSGGTHTQEHRSRFKLLLI